MSQNILVVEDDEDINRALTIRLKSAGYDVTSAFDAVLAMTEARRVNPDLVILDISMPGGSGLDVAARLKDVSGLSETPVIFITASKRPDLKAQALSLGAAGFFEKPYNAHELLSFVGNVLGPSGATPIA